MVGPYPVGRPITGGVEAVASALVGGLNRWPDIDLHLVTRADDGRASQPPTDESMTVLPASRWSRATLYRNERSGIVKAIRQIDPDVVHVQGQNFYAVGALDAGYPTVVTLHGMLAQEAKITDRRSKPQEQVSKRLRGFFNTWFETATLRRAKHVIVISPYVTQRIGSKTNAECYAIDNPIEDDYFDLTNLDRGNRLFFAGALEPRKRIDHMIEAVGILRRRGVSVDLRIAGRTLDPGYAASLAAKVRSEALGDSVHFLGLVSQEEIFSEYRQCSLVVMASVEETSPMLIQQAMAAGKAVVASDAGGIPYLVADHHSGRLYRSGNTRAFADTIEELLVNANLRTAMGREGRRIAESRFRAQKVAERTIEVYERVAGGYAATPAPVASMLPGGVA
jgi:glycosyltransferase involved in cell wall biosynthesis